MDNFIYKSSFEQLPALVIVLDLNFNIVAVSNAYLEATQTNRKVITGQNLFDVFPDNPNDTTADGVFNIRASLNRVIQNKIADKIAVIKYDIPKPASEGGGFMLKYWRPIHSPVFDEFNNVKLIMQFVEDITENETLVSQLATEKKILKEVADSEKRYSMLLMKSPFAFAVFKGKELIITLANDSIKKIWGKGNEVEGHPLYDILPELKDSPIPRLIDEVYKTGIPFYGDELLVRLQRGNKMEDLYFTFVYQPYLEADETISGVTVIVYEVTKKVVLKKELSSQLETEIKALKRIEDSNKRFYTMLMQSPFAFSIMKGNELVITLANDKMKSFWGKGKDVEGKALLEVLPELTDQPFPAMMREVFTTGIPIYANEILARLQHQGRMEEHYFNIVYQPHLEADENISGVFTIAYEVTEMVLARKKVEESEHRFQGAVAAIKGILWTNNASGEMEGIQKSWTALTGQSAEEYQGYGWSNAIHPDDKVPTIDAWNKAVTTKSKFVFEHRLKLKNGTWGQFSVKAIPLFNPDGMVREWVGVHIDISNQRKAETAVKESEYKFRSMMETIPQIAWTNTIKLEVTFYNKRWYDYTGLNFEQTKLLGWQKVIHPHDLNDTLQQFKNILKTKEGGEFQVRLEDSDQQYKWHLIRLMPIKNEAGTMQLWVGSATDIQALKLLQQQKDDFISIASHELKTPLTSLKLSLQLLKELKDSVSPPLVSRLIIQANRSLDKFSVLINDLLNSSKANEGLLQLNKTKFILSELVADCCSHVRLEGIYTIKTEGDMEVEIFADAKKIEQIMVNFVNNSIKYAPKSKEIYIWIQKLKEVVKVSVMDKGPGIAPENLQYLFDRYYRVESNENHYSSGLGLGLYISSEIIKKHGGEIGVESELEKGSTFWFTLPLIA